MSGGIGKSSTRRPVEPPHRNGLRELHAIVEPARRGIRYLEWLTWLSRLQSLQFVLFLSALPLLFLIYVLLQFVLLWDFHVASALSWWRKRFGRPIDEALRRGTDRSHFVAGIDRRRASRLDVRSNPPRRRPHSRSSRLGASAASSGDVCAERRFRRTAGTVMLITGSNMSGKSTLLRAVGTNVVLRKRGGRSVRDRS